MKRSIFLLGLLAVVSCGGGRSELSRELETQLVKNKWERIDLATVGGPVWGKVCIFGPYSDNARAERTLGFKWDLEKETSIYSSDSANVFVFIKDKNILSHMEHPRNLGDFAELSGKCFERSNAMLIREQRSDGWRSFVATR